jgi:histone-arginine methyltransferase CARM1
MPCHLLSFLWARAAHPCTLHGIASWFDMLFKSITSQRWLSTAPNLPTTH